MQVKEILDLVEHDEMAVHGTLKLFDQSLKEVAKDVFTKGLNKKACGRRSA